MAGTIRLVLAVVCIGAGIAVVLISGGLPFQGLPPITIPNFNQAWNPSGQYAPHPTVADPTPNPNSGQPTVIVIRPNP